MRSLLSKRLFLLSAACALVALASIGATVCRAAPASGVARGDQLVVLADDVAPSLNLDGANASHPNVQEALQNIMEPLVEYPRKANARGILVPNYRVGPS